MTNPDPDSIPVEGDLAEKIAEALVAAFCGNRDRLIRIHERTTGDQLTGMIAAAIQSERTAADQRVRDAYERAAKIVETDAPSHLAADEIRKLKP